MAVWTLLLRKNNLNSYPMNIRLIVPVILLMMGMQYASGENGYDLWLRYNRIGNQRLIQEYVSHNRNIVSIGSDNPTIKVACDELCHALSGLTGVMPSVDATVDDGTVILCTGETLPKGIESRLDLDGTGEDGFVITSSTLDNKQVTLIVGESAVGTLYGTFRYIGLMQTGGSLENLGIRDAPRLRHRMLNHWDNLNGTIERGYAGYSLWNWERLPQDCDPRYIDYARANASIGINGVVVNNVNASARSLRHVELVRLSGLADAWRPYGIKVYLTAKFSAPIEIGGLSTADPLSPEVQAWWKRKVDEIYEIIPDFGGFLVKANSEGQPGPQDYGRTHADGANMLGDALAPHGGVVFWRAFVYKNDRHNDRVKGGYEEFKPLDGKFRDNVMVQPKNGPIDFQPREPFHPLIGEMPRTALSVEFQITQENL